MRIRCVIKRKENYKVSFLYFSRKPDKDKQEIQITKTVKTKHGICHVHVSKVLDVDVEVRGFFNLICKC